MTAPTVALNLAADTNQFWADCPFNNMESALLNHYFSASAPFQAFLKCKSYLDFLLPPKHEPCPCVLTNRW